MWLLMWVKVTHVCECLPERCQLLCFYCESSNIWCSPLMPSSWNDMFLALAFTQGSLERRPSAPKGLSSQRTNKKLPKKWIFNSFGENPAISQLWEGGVWLMNFEQASLAMYSYWVKYLGPCKDETFTNQGELTVGRYISVEILKSV